MENRYDRQERIPGWNQERLTSASVAVIGSGPVGQFLCAGLAALGVGRLEVYGDDVRTPGDPLVFLSRKQGSTVACLADTLTQMNPLITIRPVQWTFMYGSHTQTLGPSSLIVDATNSPVSKRILHDYAVEKMIPFISIAASDHQTSVSIITKNGGESEPFHASYNNIIQGAMPSALAGGLVAEEVRKLLMPLPEDSFVPFITYDLQALNRLTRTRVDDDSLQLLRGKKVLQVGAGSLGNWYSLGMARSGIERLDIIDDDNIETLNLNRQILLYNRIGENKADVLSQRLQVLNPMLQTQAFNARFTQEFADKHVHEYDLIADCVDNFKTRDLENRVCVQNGIALVSGGTDARSGQALIYVPRVTRCLQCALDIKILAEAERKQDEAPGCLHVPDPSVVTTNQVVAALMVGESVNFLSEGRIGKPFNGIIKYVSNGASRLSTLPGGPACNCHEVKV